MSVPSDLLGIPVDGAGNPLLASDKLRMSQLVLGCQLPTVVSCAGGYSGFPHNPGGVFNQYGQLGGSAPPAVGDYSEYNIGFPGGRGSGRGTYLWFSYIVGPNLGTVTITWDGVAPTGGGVFDTYAATGYPVSSGNFVVMTSSRPGLHKLRFTVTGKNAASSNYYFLLGHFTVWTID